ncbi:MAG: arylsulfotransferase family protein, partial [Pseudomonadota bacterium]
RYLQVKSFEPDRADIAPVPAAPHLALRGLAMRGDPSAVPRGWRILVGTFDWEGSFSHGAVLISPEFEAIHFWPLDETDIGEAKAGPAHRRVPHGFALLPDAAAVVAFDGGMSLQRIGHCGEAQWQIAGAYHHVVTLADDGRHVWSIRDDVFEEVDVETGEVTRSVDVLDIIAANPQIDILEIRRLHHNDIVNNSRDRDDPFMHDPFHFNDVEPLPHAIADAFPQFKPGDLMVSSRSLNLVMVFDPDSREVKWWRVGAWKRQHDPDWLPSGKIAVFDNQMNREWSRIVEIDPQTFEVDVTVDGERHDFYTRIRGKHQILTGGGHLMVSSQQARAIELGANGEVALEFLNLNGDDKNLGYTLTDYMFVPEAAFKAPLPCEPVPAASAGERRARG